MRQDPFFAEVDRAFGIRAHGRFEPNADVYIDEARARMVVHVELAGSDGDELRVAVDERLSLHHGHAAPTARRTARRPFSKKKFSTASSSNAFACRCRSMMPARPQRTATAS